MAFAFMSDPEVHSANRGRFYDAWLDSRGHHAMTGSVRKPGWIEGADLFTRRGAATSLATI